MLDGELDALFAPFTRQPRILVAVSGGPDSSALLFLAARWRARRSEGPELFAATVDHGLRPESGMEATAVAALAAQLGIPHAVLLWTGRKPERGIQEAAREARYALLGAQARSLGAPALALAHTLDDQAETVLFRMARGSGLSGLRGMQAERAREGLTLLRPLLDVPKSRLVATLEAAGIAYARDPSNLDTRFARPRLRAMAPGLTREGLDARRLARLATRLARADAALEAATDTAAGDLSLGTRGTVTLDLPGFAALPDEIALRLLGRVIGAVGTEGPVELAKLEAFLEVLRAAMAPPAAPFRRTLAGAVVSLAGFQLHVSPAPPRGMGGRIASNSSDKKAAILGKWGPRS
ncbi:tRNA lysidine(34) synthetase TilS [Xanthobacter sp. KR7-65]|uniref:tRNA lysidine(34) synthetase TilS n=1 Tax=Xanthobacter sp. KR7-65 TaxID=3156612 RepID=UPI0032B53906